MTIERLTLKMYAENCYIYHNSKDCIIFDPGSDFERIKSFIDSKQLNVTLILLTHCHSDHFGVASLLQDHYKVDVYCNENDLYNIDLAIEESKHEWPHLISAPIINKYLVEGDVIDFNGIKIKVIFTPGHTRGGICFYIEDDKFLITGDTLFLESIGSTMYEGGNIEDLTDSIKNKLYALPEDVTVFPGHGASTTIGHEKKSNPFIRG